MVYLIIYLKFLSLVNTILFKNIKNNFLKLKITTKVTRRWPEAERELWG